MNIHKGQLSGYEYVYVPGTSDQTLLLLHGTGGDEYDLLPLGAELSPKAHLLSPRGNVSEHGAARFFRRLAEGVFDEEDVRRRAGELSEFIQGALFRHELGASGLLAVGYSNGANIAAAVMLMRPAALRRAVLLRPMMPLSEYGSPDLSKHRVLLLNGTNDPIIPRSSAEKLKKVLKGAGADVGHEWVETGHNLSPKDLALAGTWLRDGQDK